MDLTDDLLLSADCRTKKHVYSWSFTQRIIELLKKYENDERFIRNQDVAPRAPVIDLQNDVYLAWIATPSDLEMDYLIAYLVWKHDLLMLSGVVKLALPPGYAVSPTEVEKRLDENGTEFHLSQLKVEKRLSEGGFNVSINRDEQTTKVNEFYRKIIDDQTKNTAELTKLQERDADAEESLKEFSRSMHAVGKPEKRSYGVDIVASLTNEHDSKGLQLFKFDNPLIDVISNEICGVTTANNYISRNHTYFAVHLEDGRVYSISYNMLGFAKTWAVVPPAFSSEFERACDGIFKIEREECADYLASHKINVVLVETVRAAKVPLVVENCRQGEVIITAPGAYHFGNNIGISVAEATNFATCLFFDQAFFDADIGCAEMVNTVVLDKEQIYDNCETLGMFNPVSKPLFAKNTYRKGIFKYLVTMFNAYVIRQSEIVGVCLSRDSGDEPFVPLFNFDDSSSREKRYKPLETTNVDKVLEIIQKKRHDWEPMNVLFHIVAGMERVTNSPLTEKFAQSFWRLIWEPIHAETNPATPATIAARLQKMFFNDNKDDFTAEQIDQQLRKGHFYHPFMSFAYFRTVIQIRSLRQRAARDGDVSKFDSVIALYNRVLFPCKKLDYYVEESEFSSEAISIILSDMYTFAPFVEKVDDVFSVMLSSQIYADAFEKQKAEIFDKLIVKERDGVRRSTSKPAIELKRLVSAKRLLNFSSSSSTLSPISNQPVPGAEFWNEAAVPVNKKQKGINLYAC